MAIIYLKILHIIGAFCLFLGFGGLLGTGENRTAINRLVFGLHGAGLLILFLTGFAVQGMGKLGFPVWLIVKLVLWVLMVLLFVLVKRGKVSAKSGVLLSLIVGAAVAWLCLAKPFLSS